MQIDTYQKIFKWLGTWDIAERYMYIFEHDINTQTVDALIKRCETGRIFLAYDSNPWTPEIKQRLTTVLENCTGNVRVLSPDLRDLWNPDPRWVYLPRWFVAQRWQTNHQTPFKPYRFGFISGEVRFHRLFLHQHCANHWTEDDAVVVHLKNLEHVRFDKELDLYYDLEQSLIKDLPFGTVAGKDEYEKQFAAHAASAGDHSNGHNAYASAVHIVGETSITDDVVLFSEKTWKALRSHCLLMTLGNPNMCDMLTELGFAVPEEIDRDLPLVQKIHWIRDRVRDWDLETCQDLYQKYSQEVEHNFQHFNSYHLVNLFHDDIQRRLQ